MGVVARQSILNLWWILLGMLIGYLNAGYLFPEVLDVPEYGMTRLIVSWSSFAILLVGAGMPAVAIRYFPLWREKGEADALMGTILLYPVLVTALLSIPVLVFRTQWVSAYEDGTGLFARYGLLIIPYTMLLAYAAVLNAIQRLHLRTVNATFWLEVGARLPNTLVILAYAAGWIDIDTFFYLFAAAPLAAVAGLWLSLKPSPRWAWPRRRSLSRKQWKELWAYNFHAALNGLPSMLFRHVDMILVGKFLSLAKAGIYGLSVLFSVLVEVSWRAISMVAVPLISRHMAEKQWEEARKLFHQTLSMAFLISVGVALLLTVNLPWAVSFIKPAYEESYHVFRWLLFVPLLRVLLLPVIMVLSFSSAFRWQTVSNFIGVTVNVLLDIWMIPQWGLYGAAWASIIAAALTLLLAWMVGLRKVPDVITWPAGAWKWLGTAMLALAAVHMWSRSGDIRQWEWIAVGNLLVGLYGLVAWRLLPEMKLLLAWRRR